jgi:hypothetical protein
MLKIRYVRINKYAVHTLPINSSSILSMDMYVTIKTETKGRLMIKVAKRLVKT